MAESNRLRSYRLELERLQAHGGTMKLCADGHDEVCFNGNRCPACHEINKRDVIIETLRDKRDEHIETLRDEIKDLRDNQRDD